MVRPIKPKPARRPRAAFDFISDWHQLLADDLTARGYTVATGHDVHAVTRMHLNVGRRRIEPASRTVHRASSMACPPDLLPGLEALLAKVARGEDVNPHQSKFLLDGEYKDSLLNDWGIHHFHLGTAVDRRGLIERTGPLLFARVDGTEFYAIGVLPHGSWTDRALLEVLHAEWPDSIRRHRLIGMSVEPIDEATHQEFRKAGLVVMVTLADGTTYAPLGGGYATSGDSILDVRDADRTMSWLRAAEDAARERAPGWLKDLADRGEVLGAQVRFHLRPGKDGVMFAVYKTSGFRLGEMT